MRFQGKTAIVTGAAGGIGGAVARQLASEGANLCLADLRASTVLLDEIRALGRQAIDQPTDVTDAVAVKTMLDRTLDAFGRVDILVNVAGIVSLGSSEDVTEAEWDRVLTNNLKSVFLCCKTVIPVMRAQRYGRIVNMGSLLGKNGGNPRPWIDRAEQKRASNLAYGASKAGIHALTIYLAKELAVDGITVNAVAPGPVASAMTADFPETLRALIPVGRMGKATDVAEAVAFLASDGAAFITAEILDVNGGMLGD
jgi:3-oxoacyl-[acyl-carrier protein] reductase